MDETFGSESSSGCESGWTLYLDHSIHSLQNHTNENGFISKKDSFTYEYDDEEEDMSMVSDASSGPQHFPEQEDECNNNNGIGSGGVYTNGKRKKSPKEAKLQNKIHDLPSFLDDTASSPLYSFPNNNLTMPRKKASVPENEVIDYSQGYSSTYFKGNSSALQDHFGYFHPQVQQNQW